MNMRKPISTKQTQWAENLQRIWFEKKKHLNLTQEKAGDLLGWTQGAVGHYLNGRTPLNTDAKIKFAKLLDVAVTDIDPEFNMDMQGTIQEPSSTYLLTPLSTWDSNTPLDDDEAELPLFREVELSAGNGMSHVIENHGAKLRFSKATLRAAGVSPGNGACCFASGDSMGKVVPHGATVGVDKGTTQIIDGEIYAIDHGGLLKVKYLYRLPSGGIRIRSEDRDEFPDEDLNAEQAANDLRIIGFVFWISALRTRNKPKN